MKGIEFIAQVRGKAPFSKMHPKMAEFFRDYLSNEKVISFGDQFVLNTHLPPFPSRAFDNMAEHFNWIGDSAHRRLFSVTLAVTNRCGYNCWHCYNAGRSQQDVPLAVLKNLIGELQGRQVTVITLSGGEPLLRDDLEEIVGAFDDRASVVLNTTGATLTAERAKRLHESGLFALGVSLDSTDRDQHDRMRGITGAFDTALEALTIAGASGLYPYVIVVATHDFLKQENFYRFIRFAADAGALEVHLLEPSATGKLAGNSEVLLSADERTTILRYQREVSKEESLPILSTFAYLESPDAFGCGAGLSHLYIDGSGEVSPCNLVPMSFGNVTHEPLGTILDEMGRHFVRPRSHCLGCALSEHIDGYGLPTRPEISARLCEQHLPRQHETPRFFRVRAECGEEVGVKELRSAYNHVHEHYDQFWAAEAGRPVVRLVERLAPMGGERVLEAGCGTGLATELIARLVGSTGAITAVDISDGMLTEARKRVELSGMGNVRFVNGDALTVLGAESSIDIVFCSWVLGYIPLAPFFAATAGALREQGRLAFVVHRESSPREPLEIFAELVAEDPSVLTKRVAFDFPRDVEHVRREVCAVGMTVKHLSEGAVIFRYGSAEDVLEHLLKSGAGTAFHDALEPSRRQKLEARFLERLRQRKASADSFDVVHDYIECIATKESCEDSDSA